MKLLFDENLSPKLVSLLRDVYPDASHIHFAGLDQAGDTQIWEFAKAGGWSIVTKDSDFHQRSMVVGHPPKVIWLRVGNCSVQAIAELLRTRYISIQYFHDDTRAAFLALSRG